MVSSLLLQTYAPPTLFVQFIDTVLVLVIVCRLHYIPRIFEVLSSKSLLYFTRFTDDGDGDFVSPHHWDRVGRVVLEHDVPL